MKCTIVGSASLNNYSKLLNECINSDFVIAADGGINHLEKINFAPDLFLGDMDSVFSEKNKKRLLPFFNTINKSFVRIVGTFKKVDSKKGERYLKNEVHPLNFINAVHKEIFEKSKTCNFSKAPKVNVSAVLDESKISREIKSSLKKKFLKELIKKRTKIITLPKEKDLTDTFFAVKEAIKLDATEINIFGGLGQKLDHSFANFCIAKYLSERNINHKLIADNFEVFIIKAGETTLISGNIGDTVSVFPFGIERCKVSYTGLKYNLEEEYLGLDSPIGISNEIIAKWCKVSVLEGYALIFSYYNF